MLVPAGATTVLVEHDLCPAVTLADIVRQARGAIAWVYRHVADYGGNPLRLYLTGLSAGGHLVAMTLAHGWAKDALPRDLIKGAVTISGVYDLEPVLHISVNQDICLDPESVRENSPMLAPPLPVAPLLIAVGGDEPAGWKEMSRDFFCLCLQQGVDCRYLEMPGVHHFSISTLLAEPRNALARAILDQMGL
jgi:arylformamidase